MVREAVKDFDRLKQDALSSWFRGNARTLDRWRVGEYEPEIHETREDRGTFEDWVLGTLADATVDVVEETVVGKAVDRLMGLVSPGLSNYVDEDKSPQFAEVAESVENERRKRRRTTLFYFNPIPETLFGASHKFFITYSPIEAGYTEGISPTGKLSLYLRDVEFFGKGYLSSKLLRVEYKHSAIHLKWQRVLGKAAVYPLLITGGLATEDGGLGRIAEWKLGGTIESRKERHVRWLFETGWRSGGGGEVYAEFRARF